MRWEDAPLINGLRSVPMPLCVPVAAVWGALAVRERLEGVSERDAVVAVLAAAEELLFMAAVLLL